MTQLKLGVIGIGAFGSRVALRLLWSGYHTLEIYDVADVATRLFTNDYGGMAIGSPKMMAQTCDAVITVLPSAAELREVCFGWEGLAEGFADGGIVIDLGTTDPVATVEIADKLAARRIDLVAAPAFGTPAQAKEGKLTMVVGGAEDAVARCRPVLDLLATKALQAGAAGAAQAAGAIADFLRGARLLAASEAIRLGQRYGFEPAAVLSLGEALGGDVGETLRREVVTRNFKTGLAARHPPPQHRARRASCRRDRHAFPAARGDAGGLGRGRGRARLRRRSHRDHQMAGGAAGPCAGCGIGGWPQAGADREPANRVTGRAGNA